jgi:hypothetical protein
MSEHLSIALGAAVPLHIEEIRKAGGPTVEDFKAASGFSGDLAHRGDVLLFGGGKKGEAAELFNKTARAIAVLAFLPGGVTLFGNHWEVKETKP